MADVESKLVTPGGDTVVLKPESIPEAKPSGKGGVLQGEAVAKSSPLDDNYVKSVNSVLDSLRESGALANTKFRVLYDGNPPVGEEDMDFGKAGIPEDDNIYESGGTATVMFADEYNNPPYISGYIFLGWALTPNAQTPDYPYNESDPQTYTLTFVNDDITLYAVWQLRTVTITYSLGQYGQGSVPAAQTVIEGGKADISFSPAPTVNDGSGRVFIGWSYNDGNDSIGKVDFSTLTSSTSGNFYSDTTLYPVFAAQYTLTYALGNDATGTVPSAQTAYNGEELSVNFNPSVTCISDPTKVFIGWAYNDESSSPDFSINGTGNIFMNSNFTLYPVFGEQASGDAFEIVNIGQEDVTVSHDDKNLGDYVIDLTVSANSTATFNASSDTTYVIAFILDKSTTTRTASFSGSYDGVSYNAEQLQIGSSYNTYDIAAPDGSCEWDGSASISGTLTVDAK